MLPNGSALLAGGLKFVPCEWPVQSSLSVIHLVSPTAAIAGQLNGAGRVDAVASGLPSGEVLVSGGSDGTAVLASAEVFSAQSAASHATWPLASARVHHTKPGSDGINQLWADVADRMIYSRQQ